MKKLLFIVTMAVVFCITGCGNTAMDEKQHIKLIDSGFECVGTVELYTIKCQNGITIYGAANILIVPSGHNLPDINVK